MLPLLIGLVVGGVGVTMFLESMPGSAGSPEERANKLEIELKRAQNRIAALEARFGGPPRTIIERLTGGSRVTRWGAGLADNTRRIIEDIREGQLVIPTTFSRDPAGNRVLAPLFDRMRVKAQKDRSA